LLDVSRIARGKLSIEKRLLETSSAVGRAVEATSPVFERRKQRLAVQVPDNGLMVNADPNRVAQIVSNLLDNASKFSKPDSEIAISAERDGRTVRLRVKDHGIGIPHDMLGAIFDPFVQSSAQQGHTASGLGLGLSIVRKLVELQGGTVTARSDGP